MTERTPEDFARYLERRFHRQDLVETYAIVIAIWLVGVVQRLTHLGVISGGEMKEIDGLDEWAEIDEHRYTIIPPKVLGRCLASFVKAAAIEKLQEELAQVIAMYYTDVGRREITAKSLDRILLNSPTNDRT